MSNIADNLGISITSLQELKFKLKFKKGESLDEEAYLKIKDIVKAINAEFGKVTLSTINLYLEGVRNEESLKE